MEANREPWERRHGCNSRGALGTTIGTGIFSHGKVGITASGNLALLKNFPPELSALTPQNFAWSAYPGFHILEKIGG